MTTSIHAWFSFETALRKGSSIYRKPGGSTVNVTRMSADKDARGGFPHDEKYLGEVIRPEDGGCVRQNRRVPASATDPRAPHNPPAQPAAAAAPARAGRCVRR